VFGDTFRFSNCKQLTPRGRPSALQSLTRGSVILFGSQLDREFVLDTLFVVADATPYVPAEAGALDVDDAFRICTLESLTTLEHEQIDVANARLTLFRAATFNASVAGMFSFVPARPAHGAAIRFARPTIILPGYVNPDSKQSPSGARCPRTHNEVHSVWASVRRQVLDAECVLGVTFPTPELEGTAEVPITGRRAC